MKHLRKTICLGTWVAVFILSLGATRLSAADAVGAAPYIDAKAIKERFKNITAADMDELRSKKILFGSCSFGLNLLHGLKLLSQENKLYDLPYTRLPSPNKAGAGATIFSVIPADAFTKANFNHFISSQAPKVRRIDEADTLLRKAPHEFGKTVDIVVLLFEYFDPKLDPRMVENYSAKMDAMQADFPKIKVIYTVGGFVSGLKPAYQENTNEPSFKAGEQVRGLYKGKVPLFDVQAVLSDDFRVGHVQCPEYSKDPSGLHPDTPEGEKILAKGFILTLVEALHSKHPVVRVAKKPAATQSVAETLPLTHPDMKAVRAILDANRLTERPVESVVHISGGRVTSLFIQECGVTVIPDEIGQLDALKTCNIYGDRKLTYPLMTKVSPAIGRCTELEQLLLNDNDLETLPREITKLKKLKTLALGNNRMHDLPADVIAWIKQFDPNALKQQLPIAVKK